MKMGIALWIIRSIGSTTLHIEFEIPTEEYFNRIGH